MAHKRGGRGMSIGRMIMNVFWGILLIGLAMALLRAFDWDIFGIIEWIWSGASKLVTAVADFFTGNATFQKVTKAP